MFRQIFLSLFLVFPAFGMSQQFNFKKYGLEEGLPRVGVYDMHQDHRGFLWIGTEGGGVCIFDGIKFHSYTRRNGLPSDNVRIIFQDSDKTIWLATDEGICYFDGAVFNRVALQDTATDTRIRAISQDASGRLWVGTDQGLSFIDVKAKKLDTQFAVEQNFTDSTVRTLFWYENQMLVGTDSGLYTFNQSKLVPHTIQPKLSSYRILELFADVDGALWIGTANGVNKIDTAGVQQWTTAEGLVNNRVRSIEQDQYGTIWLGTSRGISLFNGDYFTTLTPQNGLTNERVRCIMKDSFKNMWVGTFYGGIMRFNYKDFIGFTTTEGLGSNQIQSICEDEYGDVLVGTSSGFTTLEVIDNKLYNYSTVKLSDNYLTNSIKAVYYDKNGYTWLGNAHGITILKGEYKKEIVFRSLDPEEANVGVKVLCGFNDKIWVGTTQGLFQIGVVGDYDSFEIVNLSDNNKLAGKEVSCITPDSMGRIWIGFSDGKISVYEKAHLITPVVPKSLEMVLSIAVDTLGNLWIGTNGNGLFAGTYNAANRSLDLKNFSTHEQLTSNYIYSILLTKDRIWLGHERGLDVLVGTIDSITSILRCGVETGFKGLQNYPNSALHDSNGNIWFGTINGLYRLNAKEESRFLEGTPSIIYLTGLKINTQHENWKESAWCDTTWGDYNLPVNLNLPYNKNNLDFEFIGLNYTAPEKIRYSWKLDGFDEDWSAPASENHVSYTNLPPGIYTFRVRASDELGIIQPNEQTLTFIILKPYWETWWFRILVAIVLLLTGIFVTRWRTRQLRLNQKKLETIIEQRTAEVKSQNEMLEEKNKEITDSIFYSRRIQRSVLPAKEKVAKLLANYFIFFRPKDIVSGDFYWAEKSLDKTKTFFAVADCTGHGVPGAMVSLIGTRALTSALRESGITRASEILDNVNESMIESFTDTATGTVIKDGMDIALCSVDYSTPGQVAFQYAGAQNSCWIVRAEQDADIQVNGARLEPNLVAHGYKLFEIKADKQPIGYFETRVLFRNNDVVLKTGDRIYLYSDGFADQFGGEKGKKFKYKTLKELILSIQNQPINQHYEAVRNAFYDWKREFEQIDDVCVMGVEV
ncbi:MAG: SpoIIE family protein phosphatase [Bacteroidetes bacterium]|nr:SpoIIE family protein phosphatase [Bacteroidota bacterium]